MGFIGAGTEGIARALGGSNASTAVRTVEWSRPENGDFPSRIDVGEFVPDLVVVATDSSLENVTQSRFITRVLKKQFPGTEKIAIATRTSEPESLSTEKIAEILGLTTYARFGSD